LTITRANPSEANPPAVHKNPQFTPSLHPNPQDAPITPTKCAFLVLVVICIQVASRPAHLCEQLKNAPKWRLFLVAPPLSGHSFPRCPFFRCTRDKKSNKRGSPRISRFISYNFALVDQRYRRWAATLNNSPINTT